MVQQQKKLATQQVRQRPTDDPECVLSIWEGPLRNPDQVRFEVVATT